LHQRQERPPNNQQSGIILALSDPSLEPSAHWPRTGKRQYQGDPDENQLRCGSGRQ
jgi:hypothetical protein